MHKQPRLILFTENIYNRKSIANDFMQVFAFKEIFNEHVMNNCIFELYNTPSKSLARFIDLHIKNLRIVYEYEHKQTKYFKNSLMKKIKMLEYKYRKVLNNKCYLYDVFGIRRIVE